MDKNIIVSIDKFDEAKNYWLEKLAGQWDEVNLEMAADFSFARLYKSANHMVYLDETESQRAIRMAKHNNLSLYILLITAFKILLHLYTGQRDIIVTSPVYNVSTQEYNKFVLLRDFLDTDSAFKEWLMKVKQTVVDGYKNQFYPIEKIIELLETKGTSSMSILKVILMLEAIHDRELLGDILTDCENYFVLVVGEEDQKLVFDVQYNSELFCADTIARLMDHYQHILKQVLEDTNIKINDIELMTWEEKSRILEDFNNTGSEYPSKKTIHQLFEDQVNGSFSKMAGIYEDQQLTYGELNGRANQLARELRERGVAPGAIVGIMVERSLEMIVGLLGILKSGGAYLPLDPEYPQERIKYMLSDGNVDVILSQQHLQDRIGISFAGQLICLEEKNLYLAGNSNLEAVNGYKDLAYVIFTSGSTGKPKGVMIDHGSIVNTLYWRSNYYEFDDRDAVLQIPSFSFDSSVEDIFTPLLCGSKLVLIEQQQRINLEYLGELIGKHRVTHFLIVPNFYKTFLQEIPEVLKDLRSVTVAGDNFTEELVKEHFAKLDHVKLYNEYGPTENSVCATVYEFATEKTRVLIGKPINNVRCYILDKRKKLSPVGVPGELCISGAGLARSYLNSPQLTQEKFVKHPFISGERVYRTGDLAQWLMDGHLEFLGRVDQQIKIRGFRVELGEIETQLRKNENISEAVVVTKEDENSGKYLCAYIVSDKEFAPSELIDYLSGILPSYMIPAYFVPLKKLPLTPNGKINRKALPAPQGRALGSGGKDKDAYPKNAIEKKLWNVWCDVLGKDNIGVNDNFFMIGGDSIKSIQISARMNKAGYKVEVRDIFQNPTITKLAPLVKKMKRIAPQDLITGEIPLTPIQEWFFSHQGIYPHHHNHAVMLHSQEGFDVEAMKAIFLKLQEHHDVLRMRYKRVNGKITQYNQGLDYPFSLQVYDLRNQEDALEILEGKANEIQVSIDLEKGPLMKLGLFHLDDGDRLLIVIHHLVIDGISWRILFEDFEVLHEQCKKGEDLSLPFKTDSYKLWSEKLLEYANSKQFLKEKEYWKKLESTPVPFIKVDMSEGDNYIKDSERLSFRLSEEETNDLLGEVNKAYNTEINDILLSALGLTIRECFGIVKLAINLEGHGREEVIDDLDISRTFGWFTSIYPVILDLSFENDLARQIKEVKEDLHRVPNRGIGYGILAYLTSTEKKEEIELKLKPQISFNYLGQFDADLSEKSFKIARESSGNTICPDSERLYELVISGMITNNKLEMSIAYSNRRFKQETIRTFLDTYHIQLLHVINFCKAQDKTEVTPSDMDYKGLTIDEFETIFQ